MIARPVTIALAIAAGIGWLGFPGLLWDVAWHRTVGRDSFLSPPHVLMYAGVAVNGLVAAWAVMDASWWRRDTDAFGGRVVRLGAVRVPLGFGLAGLGVLLALVGAGLDEYWHRYVGKDVNLWSPPHLVGLAGTMVIVLGLIVAIAAHTRYRRRPAWRAPRILLLFCFADLVHKSIVALDHYALDDWGRTPDFYPFLLCLLLAAIFVAAARALGPGGAAGTAVVFMAQHAVVLAILLTAGMRAPTFSPFPLLPALAIEAVLLLARDRERARVAVLAGVAFAVVVVLQESAWMAWVAERPWPLADVLRAAPTVLLAGAGSAWVGWALGGLVEVAGGDRAWDAVFGGPARARAVGVVAAVLVVLGLVAVYRPSPAAGPAPVEALGLAPDTAFDYRDAVFWDALLPDGWQQAGEHHIYQEGIVDGHPFPLGPGWCAIDEATMDRELGAVTFRLTINGRTVDLDRYPWVRRRTWEGRACRWVAVSAMTPVPGRQTLIYEIRTLDRAPARVVIDLVIKQP